MGNFLRETWQAACIVAHILPVKLGGLQDICTHQQHLKLGVPVVVAASVCSPSDPLQLKGLLYRDCFTRKHPGFKITQLDAWEKLTGDKNPIHTSVFAAVDAGTVRVTTMIADHNDHLWVVLLR